MVLPTLKVQVWRFPAVFWCKPMKQVLLICNDTIGHKMAGPAIRCMELAKALSSQFDVVVSAQNLDVTFVPPFAVVPATLEAVEAAAGRADVIVIQGDALRRYPTLLKTEAVLVADLYCPIPLEYHMSSHGVAEDVRLRTGWYVAQLMQQQLFYADHFLCASDRQKDFWVGALTMAGRINALSMPDGVRTALEQIISCVPFGLPDVRPIANGSPLRTKFGIAEDDFLMVWGGGIYEWFDPLTIIRAVAELDRQGLKAHLVFLGVKHPNPGINEHDRVSDAVNLARELGVLDRLVHFNFGWIDYHIRHEYLLDADVGVSAHLDNAETRYSFRTRMLDYLWCGLPILATRGDEFGDMAGGGPLGVAIDYEDSEAWCVAIRRMMTDAGFVAECRANVERVRVRYTWSRVTEPLADVCRRVLPSPDRAYARANANGQSGGTVLQRPSLLVRVRDAYGRYGLGGTIKAVLRRVKHNLVSSK